MFMPWRPYRGIATLALIALVLATLLVRPGRGGPATPPAERADAVANPVFDPMDPNHELLNISNNEKPETLGQWTTMKVPGAPAQANAVILNIYGHIRGANDAADVDNEPRLAMVFRQAGSKTEPANYSFAVYAASNTAYTVGQNTVLVPLDERGRIEYRGEMILSGGANDSAHVRVYVQGFLSQ